MSLKLDSQPTSDESWFLTREMQPVFAYRTIGFMLFVCLFCPTWGTQDSVHAWDLQRPASHHPDSLHRSVNRDIEGGTSNPRALVATSHKGRFMLAQSLRDVTDQEYRVATFISAARDGDIEAVKKLLDEGMDVNAKNKSGNTALMEACGSGREDVINLLLDKGADAKAQNNIKETAASKAIKNKQYRVLSILQKRQMWTLNADSVVDILRYADVDFVRLLFSKTSQENQKEILKFMRFACESGKVEVVRLFLENGADPDQHKGLPLRACSASTGPPVEAVKLLLDKGANVNLWDKESALHVAAASNRPDVVKLLLEKGADVNARNENGKTALLECLGSPGQNSLDPVVRVLLEKGANANDKDKDGITALMYAAFTGRIDVVNMLLEKGADINHKTPKGGTALGAAMKGESKEIVTLLKKRGARQ